MEKFDLESLNALSDLKDEMGIQVAACEGLHRLKNSDQYKKLDLTRAQKLQISGLGQAVLPAMAAAEMANAYTVKFPLGLPHALTALKQGGFGSMIRSNGKFVGTASFYPMDGAAAVLSVFTALSAVTGQYFLAQINHELDLINMKMDKILEFLYENKKAELMAETMFIKSAYENYSSIILHEQQTLATITNLQRAKILAMQNMEFYNNLLKTEISSSKKSKKELQEATNKALRTRDSLILSQELYIMSSLMEVFYSQNQEPEYLSYLEKEILENAGKSEKRMLESFSSLETKIQGLRADAGKNNDIFGSFAAVLQKPQAAEPVDVYAWERPVIDILDSLKRTGEPDVRDLVSEVLRRPNKPAEYYIDVDGEVYVKE